METKLLQQSDLDQFTGTENYYKSAFGLLYTDGIAFMAEKAGAYWLIDAIASYHRKEHFQVWTLRRSFSVGTLVMREDTDAPVLVRQRIHYTDFPLVQIKLYVVDGVLMLPSEY